MKMILQMAQNHESGNRSICILIFENTFTSLENCDSWFYAWSLEIFQVSKAFWGMYNRRGFRLLLGRIWRATSMEMNLMFSCMTHLLFPRSVGN